MKNLIFIVFVLLSIVSCKKMNLDDLAFPREKLNEYMLDDYEGEVEVDSIYNIPQDKVHLFTVNSRDEESGVTYEIYAIYIGDLNTIATDTVILYTHGQSKHMDNYWSRAKLLANTASKNQYGLLMMDYRGYGMSEGEPTERGLNEDVEACIKWLVEKGVQQENTIYYGYSLGCIPAIHLAAYKTEFKPAKLILESPLASVENLTHSSTLLNVNPKFVSSLEFNNAEKIKDVDIPLLWFHGIEDTYIEISNGQLIYDNHQGTFKEAHKIEGTDHTEVPANIGHAKYLEIINNFILME